MTRWSKTITMVLVAGGMIGLAYATRPSSRPLAERAEQGVPLAPLLTDPGSITDLEVLGWDDASAKPRGFKVKKDGNRWVVPSAFNYPVDATSNMAAAASSFIGLVKERVVTDRASEHERLGVIAPDDATSTKTSGRGTRVTLRDTSGTALVDLVLGKAVEADPALGGAPDKKYVREVGKNRVYVTTLTNAFSTKFVDWVNTDLLELPTPSITTIEVDRYTINEQTGQVGNMSSLTLKRTPPITPPPAAPGTPPPATPPAWSLATEPATSLAQGESLNQQAIDETLNAINRLRIVGVRPKPTNLAKALSGIKNGGGGGGNATINIGDQFSLQAHGFYLARDGALLANEGQMTITSDSGLIHTLWFGELAPPTDEPTKDQTAGATGGGGGADGKVKPAPNGRYMMITVAQDPAYLGDAPPPTKPGELIALEEAEKAASPEKPLSDEQKQQLETLRFTFDNQSKAYESKKKTLTDRLDAAARRFGDWYYVIDATSLEKLRPTRDALVTK